MKLKNIKVTVTIALCAGLYSVMANNNPPCVPSSHEDGICGTSQGPSLGNNCTEIICNTAKVDCTGPQSDLYCNPTPYTATCYKNVYYRHFGYFGDYCDLNAVTSSGMLPQPCEQVTDEVGGCGG